jgi:hypothetical protein
MGLKMKRYLAGNLAERKMIIDYSKLGNVQPRNNINELRQSMIQEIGV